MISRDGRSFGNSGQEFEKLFRKGEENNMAVAVKGYFFFLQGDIRWVLA